MLPDTAQTRVASSTVMPSRTDRAALWHSELTDALYSLCNSLAGLSQGVDPDEVLSLAYLHLKRFLPFRTAGFFVCGVDGIEFNLGFCEPSAQRQVLTELVEAEQTAGTFAWSMQQNRPVVLHKSDGYRLVMHPLSTRSRTVGMFAGIIASDNFEESEAVLRALSLILINTAYAYENVSLYQQIQSKNGELENAVHLRDNQLKELMDATEHRSKQKTNFLAAMSHEIRTPMNGVLGFSNLLLEAKLDANHRDYVQIIHSSAEKLLTLIDDILDFSKIEADKIVLKNEPFSPVSCIEECLKVLLPKANEKGLRLAFLNRDQLPAIGRGDEHRLRQIVLNLLSNAIRHTATGSVTVEIRTLSDDNNIGEYEISVADTGEGIPTEHLHRIFEPFFQVQRKNRTSGTGLGLAISQRLARAMRGGITVESREGKGSTFRLRTQFEIIERIQLGACVANGSRDSGLAQTRSALAEKYPMNILVVDDNAINYRVASLMLQKLGYHVDCLDSGREAIKQSKFGGYELIFMDLHMPELDGLETTKQIRGTFGIKRQPFVCAVTADVSAGIRDKCQRAGFDDYVAKPVTYESLVSVIQKFGPRVLAQRGG
jgi:signal transduction histidine kinase/ActR/RegA family two-component response regulator